MKFGSKCVKALVVAAALTTAGCYGGSVRQASQAQGLVGSWREACVVNDTTSNRKFYVFNSDGSLKVVRANWTSGTECAGTPTAAFLYGQEQFVEGNMLTATERELDMTYCDGDSTYYTQYRHDGANVVIAETSGTGDGSAGTSRADDFNEPRLVLEPISASDVPAVSDPVRSSDLPGFCLSGH